MKKIIYKYFLFVSKMYPSIPNICIIYTIKQTYASHVFFELEMNEGRLAHTNRYTRKKLRFTFYRRTFIRPAFVCKITVFNCEYSKLYFLLYLITKLRLKSLVNSFFALSFQHGFTRCCRSKQMP